MASFGNANNFVDKDGTFTIKIVDPIGNNVVDDDAIKEHEEYCEYISRTLKKAKIFEFNDGSIVLKITIAKNPISELEDCSDKFSDGKVFVYVEEKLKVSDYLHFTNKENLVLSLRTASLIKLDDERFISLKNGVYRLFNDDEILKLKEMGFVVPDVSEYKQLQRIRKNTLTAKADRSSYTILTTTNCNARCPYCYEQGIEQISMSPATQKRIVDLICADQVKKVHISWFGGEPLLNTSAMDYITEQMNENGKEYSESIVTNGFLIDKYISNIAKWHISNVQITLDGIYEKYDNVKQFINEHNSFERIISNISLLLDNDVPVSIRLNFSDRNYLDILECIDYIYNKFGNNRILRVYAHHIFNESYHLNDGTNIYTIIFRKLMDCGYITSLEDLGLKARNYFCFVNNRSHKVIDPNGDMYLCEHITRNSSNKKVGNIVEGITNIENYNYWSSISYPYSECRKCKFIFLCQGGCKNNKDANDKSCCLPFIDSIDEIIISYYNRRRCDNGNNRTKRNQYD